jgi:hypothetical protein
MKRFARLRAELLAFAELVAATALAIAQPTFDLLSRNVFVLTLRRVDQLDLVVIAMIVLFVPPTLLLAFEVVIGLVHRRARRIAHTASLVACAVVFALGTVKNNSSFGPVLVVALAALLSCAFGALVWRSAMVRSWLRFAAIAAPMFGLIFVSYSPASEAADENFAASESVIGAPHRVVFIVLDELPLASIVAADGSGTIDATLVPNLARLASDATWYRNNATVAPLTDAVLPAMLSGRMPKSATVPAISARYPDSLFSLLAGDYAIHAHESVTQVCPVSLCHVELRQSLSASDRIRVVLEDAARLLRKRISPTRSVDVIDLAGAFSLDPDPLATGVRFVNAMKNGNRPRLDFLHVFLPHLPWQYLADGRRVSAASSGEPGSASNRWPTAWAASAGRQRHLMQLVAADRLVGMVLDKLEQLDEYDDAMVILTADHGAAFTEGEPIRGLSRANAAQIVWTPLFVKYPGQVTGNVDDRLSRSVDLVPTIADVLDVELTWSVDGRSLLGERRDPVDSVHVLDWSLSPLHPADGSSTIEIEANDNFAEALAGLPADNVDRTGAGDPARLSRLGPYGALLGTRVEVSDDVPTLARGAVAQPERFANVDPAAPVLSFVDVAGSVEGDGIGAGTKLVIGVNGVIAGFAEVAADGRPTSWFARLDVGAFVAGRNEIMLFSVTGPVGAPVFTPIALG